MMDTFVNDLEKEIDAKLKEIESTDLNIMKKSLDASLILSNAFQKLKEFILAYTFHDETEEIEFFKVIKPRICHQLIYYRKVYNIEMNRPVGVESQRSYLQEEIKAINRYNTKRSDLSVITVPGLPIWIPCIIRGEKWTRHFIWNHFNTNVIRCSQPTVTLKLPVFLPTTNCFCT